MSIPRNISKDHIKKAIAEIDETNIPSKRRDHYYTLVENNKSLPVKYVISLANKFANGVELLSTEFDAVDAKKYLENQGFTVINNRQHLGDSFFPQLHIFLTQSLTDDIRTSKYAKSFQDLSVEISFGKGNQARVPWIAFLSAYDKVQNGIYPVYLFYKKFGLLILAYGVSETHAPNRNWQVAEIETIEEYFKRNNLGKPDRYRNSFVFKVYNVIDGIVNTNEDEINSDLNELISIYKSNQPIPTRLADREINFNPKLFVDSALHAGFHIQHSFFIRFCASLLTKPFVILTGLSGSGKTKLAQAFVKWICKDDSQYCMIPVGSDWTNREPLLGYPNALNPGEYVKPDSGVLDLIIRANNNQHLPYFLILDEMNLSHVERYFADFLSVMESKDKIPLHTKESIHQNDSGDNRSVPGSLKLPSNLFIIGTVNIDETTNMFSPKVLDRANTIEFRITKGEMENFLGNVKSLNIDIMNGKGAEMAQSFLDMASDDSFATPDAHTINHELILFFSELTKMGAEFGYRSATEILKLIHRLSLLDSTLTTDQKIDIAIMQKLLPKLHGSRRKICPVLETLGTFCISGEKKNVLKDVFEKPDFDYYTEKVKYPLSLEKISRMYHSAIDNGFTSFAEA